MTAESSMNRPRRNFGAHMPSYLVSRYKATYHFCFLGTNAEWIPRKSELHSAFENARSDLWSEQKPSKTCPCVLKIHVVETKTVQTGEQAKFLRSAKHLV